MRFDFFTRKVNPTPYLRLHYYASVDTVSNSMVNVSIWESMAAAKQMDTLQEMLAQRDIFVGNGREVSTDSQLQRSLVSHPLAIGNRRLTHRSSRHRTGAA